MASLGNVLTSESFVQNLLLLLATAALTGLLVPLIKGRIDDRKYREQKIFESELARQSKVIEAQAKFLDDLSGLLWGFLLLSLEVTYYAERGDWEKFRAATEKYDAEGWEYFVKIRAEISKAHRLTSPRLRDALLRVYTDWFMSFDNELMRAVRDATESGTTVGDSRAWSALHQRISADGGRQVEDVLTALAEELHLTESAAQPDSSRAR